MLITALGTSHGSHTIPRNNTSTLIETDGVLYLVDCGEPASGTMLRMGKDFGALRALFVTHLHADHVGGLAQLTNMLKHARGKEQIVTWCLPSEGVAVIRAYLETLYMAPELRPPTLRLSGVDEGLCYEDDHVRVTALPTGHLDQLAAQHQALGLPNRGQAFSYIIELEGKRIAFSGDQPADFRLLHCVTAEPLDLLVMEMTHIEPEEVLPWLGTQPVRRLLLTHIHDPWHGAGEMRLRMMCEEHLPFPFTIAHDGTQIEV